MEAAANARICLIGEDLDWIDGLSIQAAIHQTLSYRAEWVANPIDVRVTSTGLVERSGHWIYDRDKISGWAQIATAVPTTAQTLTSLKPRDVRIQTSFPWRAGLASSACLSVAVCKAANPHLVGLDLARAAFDLEAHQLGRRVGPMDHLPCSMGGVVAATFRANRVDGTWLLPWPTHLRLLIVDTLTPRDTSAVITDKARRIKAQEVGAMRYVAKTRSLAQTLYEELGRNRPDDHSIGRILNQAHETMRDDMGVSTRLIEDCITVLLANGCLGAKISGTGQGGCVLALFGEEKAASLAGEALRDYPVRVLNSTVYS